MMVFSLLWGVPYLVSGQRLSSCAAGGLISVFVLATIAFGPLIAAFAGRHPLWRSWLVLAVIGAAGHRLDCRAGAAGPAPFWLLVVLVLALATGGPGPMVGIDIGRTSNPMENAGLAQSLVNTGGFLATLVVLLSVGVAAVPRRRVHPGGVPGRPGRCSTWSGVRRRHARWCLAAGSPAGGRRTRCRAPAVQPGAGHVPRPLTSRSAGRGGPRTSLLGRHFHWTGKRLAPRRLRSRQMLSSARENPARVPRGERIEMADETATGALRPRSS